TSCTAFLNSLIFSLHTSSIHYSIFFFFTTTAPTEIYTLSLHDALPIYLAALQQSFLIETVQSGHDRGICQARRKLGMQIADADLDRKSTRLNSSHVKISYAVFCLKKKKKNKKKNTKYNNTKLTNNQLSI